MHDSYVVVSLLKAIPIVLTAKILAICKVAKGLAPWASVWCGGESANAYPLKLLGGGSYVVVSNTHEFHPKLKTRNRQLSRYMKLIFSESP
jgi:hypothetical protein